MYITILTPPVITKNKIETIHAHLIEHIIGMSKNNSEKDYFLTFIDSSRETFSSYTRLYLPDEIGKETMLNIVFRKLSKEVYLQERKSIKEELSGHKNTYEEGLFIRISKKLYGKGYVGDYTKMPDFSDIETYRQKYYKKSNIIISDDNDKIISIGKNISLIDSIGEDSISYYSIVKGEDSINCICFSHTSSKNHRLAYFIHQLLDNYIRYVRRYNEHKYFFETTDYFKTVKHFIVSFNSSDLIVPSKKFFDSFKIYFLENCLTRYDQYWKIMDSIHGLKPMTNNQYKKWITEISYNDIIAILKKV